MKLNSFQSNIESIVTSSEGVREKNRPILVHMYASYGNRQIGCSLWSQQYIKYPWVYPVIFQLHNSYTLPISLSVIDKISSIKSSCTIVKIFTFWKTVLFLSKNVVVPPIIFAMLHETHFRNSILNKHIYPFALPKRTPILTEKAPACYSYQTYIRNIPWPMGAH
jgi:hypothetical protein